MSVASISEISATSEKSFEDAIQQGIARATKTLRNVRSAWVKEQEVQVENNRITTYKVVLKGNLRSGGHDRFLMQSNAR